MTGTSRQPVLLAALALSLVGLQVLAQDATSQPASAPAASGGYLAEVSGNKVNVRAGPSTNYYIVCQLNAGTRITVADEKFGWAAIKPPDGVFSYISKDFVDLAADKKSGTVNAENVRIRAGSLQNTEKTAIQLTAQKGDTVTVLGEADGFLKIVPPAGAAVYVNVDFIAKLDENGQPVKPVRTARADGATSQPSGVGVALPEATAIPLPASTQPSASAEQVAKDEAALREAEAKFTLMVKRPVLEQTFDDVKPVYESLANSSDQVCAAVAKARLAQIAGLVQNQAVLREAQVITQQIDVTSEEYKRQRDKLLHDVLEGKPQFAATGKLEISNVWQGLPGPKRYRLRDPATGATAAYIEIPDDSKLDAVVLLGKYVGVYGRREYDARTNVTLVIAEDIVVVDPTAVVAPTPVPAPAATPAPASAPAGSQPAN